MPLFLGAPASWVFVCVFTGFNLGDCPPEQGTALEADIMEIKAFASSVGLNFGHLGWCPKYRKKSFESVVLKQHFLDLLYEVAVRHPEYGIVIHEVGFDRDHVHLLVEFSMCCSPAKLAQLFKGYTSYMLQKEFSGLSGPGYYWGFDGLWTESHYFTTVGNTNLNAVRQYIRSQGQQKAGNTRQANQNNSLFQHVKTGGFSRRIFIANCISNRTLILCNSLYVMT